MSVGASHSRDSFATLFWGAVDGPADESSEALVEHALACMAAFERGAVLSPDTGDPLSLVALLSSLGEEENLVYCSPEIARGEAFDERALVFSLGVLVFEKLTERHPFGQSDTIRIARLRRGEMGSGVNYFPAVPGRLRGILMRAMGPFPEDRYKDMAALIDDLRAYARVRAEGPARRAAVSSRAATFVPKAQAHTVPDRSGGDGPEPEPEGQAVVADDDDVIELSPADIEVGGDESSVQQRSIGSLLVERPGQGAQGEVAESFASSEERAGSGFNRPKPQLPRYVYLGGGIALLVAIAAGVLFCQMRGADQAQPPASPARVKDTTAKSSSPVSKRGAKAIPRGSEPPRTNPRTTPTQTRPLAAKAVTKVPSLAPPTPRRSSGGPGVKAASLSPAVSAGLRVASALVACKISPRRALRVAVYASARGRIVRAFVKHAGARKRCVRAALKGVDLGVRLVRPGYLEWRIRMSAPQPTAMPLRTAALRP